MTDSRVTLCDITMDSTLDGLVETFSDPVYRGAVVELWVFDGHDRRMAAQALLRRSGIEATVRSSYKPLVHAFLEELALDPASAILVHYPVVRGVHEGRFLLEAYPVGFMAGGRPLELQPAPRQDAGGLPYYRVDMRISDARVESIDVAAPNVLATDHLGEQVLSSSGWVRVRSEANPTLNQDGPVQADLQRAFDSVLSAVRGYSWPGTPPYFDRMNVRIEAPFYDRDIGVGRECLSTGEAMHEDIYFSMLEMFKTQAGLDQNERTFQPGQIVPDIVTRDGPLRVTVTLEAHRGDNPVATGGAQPSAGSLEASEHWLEPAAIKSHLDALGGTSYAVLSQRGRPVWGTHVDGPGPQVVISGGQHANETSGPVGALRAAERLKREGKVGFALSPLENPDGYALFREMSAAHPNHMHHAARYTAGGGDLEYFARGFENEIRYLGRDKTAADLHINLHGYPAHEWTRPFTGYVPKGFDLWTIPKGFFLILRYKPGWKQLAESILRAVVDDLADYTPIVELNKMQLARYQAHVVECPFTVDKHIPVYASEQEAALFPITLITEAPDETIYGRDFIVAHTAQMRAVLAAVAAYQAAHRTV